MEVTTSEASGKFRRPFFPPEDYEKVCPSLPAQFETLPKAPEGHISPDQAEFLYRLVRIVRPKFVVETGFCVGHSARVIVAAQLSLGFRPQVMSVDDCRYDETLPAANSLREECMGFTLIQGDTREVLSNAVNGYLRKHEGLALSLAIIDGGHDAETATHDLDVLQSFLAMGGYLWLDDFEKVVPCSGANKAGRDFERKWGNCVRFRTEDTRGFMLFQKGF